MCTQRKLLLNSENSSSGVCFKWRNVFHIGQNRQNCSFCTVATIVFPLAVAFFFFSRGRYMWGLVGGGLASHAVKVTWYSDSAQQVTLFPKTMKGLFAATLFTEYKIFVPIFVPRIITFIRVRFYLLWRDLLMNLDTSGLFFFYVLNGKEPWWVWLETPAIPKLCYQKRLL